MDNNISSHTKKYDTDDIIFLEFEKGDKFYMVQSGSVKIMKVIKDVEKLLNIVYPGDFFGEMAILEGTTRSASAIANEPTVLLELQKENFQTVLANNTEMALKLSKMFAKRIFDSKRRLLILQLNETELRIYDCLLLLAELQNINREDYNSPQELKATINDIANWCAIKPIEVQKVLKLKAGKIDIKKDTISVKNLKEIQRQIDVKRKNATTKKVMVGNISSTITNGYYNSSLMDSTIKIDNDLIDISNKSVEEFINLLNSYINDDEEEYPTDWKKWKLGEKGYPEIE